MTDSTYFFAGWRFAEKSISPSLPSKSYCSFEIILFDLTGGSGANELVAPKHQRIRWHVAGARPSVTKLPASVLNLNFACYNPSALFAI